MLALFVKTVTYFFYAAGHFQTEVIEELSLFDVFKTKSCLKIVCFFELFYVRIELFISVVFFI